MEARWQADPRCCCSSVDSPSQRSYSPLCKEVCMYHLMLGADREQELDQELDFFQAPLEVSPQAINLLKFQERMVELAVVQDLEVWYQGVLDQVVSALGDLEQDKAESHRNQVTAIWVEAKEWLAWELEVLEEVLMVATVEATIQERDRKQRREVQEGLLEVLGLSLEEEEEEEV